MNPFHQMLTKVISSSYHSQMIRFVSPLRDYFGVNHFWYYRITFSGFYSYLGTHAAWSEFCMDRVLLSHFPCLRHPERVPKGICLMKRNNNTDYQKVLQTAWEKFQINFNINLVQNVSDGIEAFGFATCIQDLSAEEKLLNEVPLLHLFIKSFKERFTKLFDVLEDNQVDLFSHFGPIFYEQPKDYVFPMKREQFLSKLGLQGALKLSNRERDVLNFLANGYPASYIATQLNLSSRTVENYVATIKSKLGCNSKIDLIRKAQNIVSIVHSSV